MILCLYNAKCFLRAFGGRRSKKLRGRLLVLRSRQGFRKQKYQLFTPASSYINLYNIFLELETVINHWSRTSNKIHNRRIPRQRLCCPSCSGSAIHLFAIITWRYFLVRGSSRGFCRSTLITIDLSTEVICLTTSVLDHFCS